MENKLTLHASDSLGGVPRIVHYRSLFEPVDGDAEIEKKKGEGRSEDEITLSRPDGDHVYRKIWSRSRALGR